MIHRLEGNAEGEGGYTGYQNAKYWLAGGPKCSSTVILSSGSEEILVYEVLIEYLVQRHPDLVESLISSSDELPYEIIADGGRCRNISVPPYSWNGMALIDLWALAFTPTTAKDNATRLLQLKLQDLLRVELALWWRYLHMVSTSSLPKSSTTNTKLMKDELLQWLRSVDLRLAPHIDTSTNIDTSTDEWSILEPSTNFKGSNMPLTDTELPLLHGLLFVNKPSGYSTLPTKQKLFPCLSDIVNEWLSTNPKGQQRLKLALEYEDRWWDIMLQTMSSKQQRVLKRWKKEEIAKLSTFLPRPVHRLDVDTSGIVCIALTPYALRAANIMFAKKSQQVINGDTFELVHKSYVALVYGKLDRGGGAITHSIGKVWIDDHAAGIPACDISNDGSYAFVRPGDSSKLSFAPGSLREAITSYRTLTLTSEEEDALDVSRVELTAHTGRSHQLRLHMASMGHPIVGDRMHGYKSPHHDETMRIGEDRLCLHSKRLFINAWGLTADGKYEVCQVVVESDPPF
jgi:23S rRNA-/tRNA-specific pseudouridylate synthase